MAAGMDSRAVSAYVLLKPFFMVFWTVVRMDNISLLILVLISGSGRNRAALYVL
jgi:hypothetical protein